MSGISEDLDIETPDLKQDVVAAIERLATIGVELLGPNDAVISPASMLGVCISAREASFRIRADKLPGRLSSICFRRAFARPAPSEPVRPHAPAPGVMARMVH